MAFNKKKYLQNKLIIALEKSLGVVSTACKMVPIDRTTFYNWYNADPEFKSKVDDIENVALDFVETKLFKQIEKGEVSSTIFYLKTKGKKRGYIERVEHIAEKPQEEEKQSFIIGDKEIFF